MSNMAEWRSIAPLMTPSVSSCIELTRSIKCRIVRYEYACCGRAHVKKTHCTKNTFSFRKCIRFASVPTSKIWHGLFLFYNDIKLLKANKDTSRIYFQEKLLRHSQSRRKKFK